MKFHMAYSFGLDGKHLVDKETAKNLSGTESDGEGPNGLETLEETRDVAGTVKWAGTK